MDITRSNVQTACTIDSYLVDFKPAIQPIIGADTQLMDKSSLKALLASYYEVKQVHLYISGKYVDSYQGVKELAKATGMTKAQVNHAINRSNGNYHDTDIMFSRVLMTNSPAQVMTSSDIREYCTIAQAIVANRNSIYLYHKGQLVDKYSTITEAYNACSVLPVTYKGVYASISRQLTFLDNPKLLTCPAGPYDSASPHLKNVLVRMTTDSRGMLYLLRKVPRMRSLLPMALSAI